MENSNNAASTKVKATQVLMSELQKALDSAEKSGWISEVKADCILRTAE